MSREKSWEDPEVEAAWDAGLLTEVEYFKRYNYPYPAVELRRRIRFKVSIETRKMLEKVYGHRS